MINHGKYTVLYGLFILIILLIVRIDFVLWNIAPLALLACLLIFGYYGNRIEGVRRISVYVVFVFGYMVIYTIFTRLVVLRLKRNVFGIVYPFYLTILETAAFWFICVYDIPKCCLCKKVELNNENKESESGSGAIYYWPDRDLYVLVSAINVFTESYRIASVIFLRDDISALILTCISSVLTEIMTRNNLYYEIIYRIIWRQSAPPLTRVYSIYLGCKLHTEYIPIFVVILYNLLHFGYTADCYYERIMDNMDITSKWWLIAVFFGLELSCDIVGHWSNKCFVKVLKVFEKADEARRVKYVKLELKKILLASLYLTWTAQQAFIFDASTRQLE